jgi:tetratricopeptide (TPR) repeat protein
VNFFRSSLLILSKGTFLFIVFSTVLVMLWSTSCLFADQKKNEIETYRNAAEIEKLQNRSLYDSALLLANQALQLSDISFGERQNLINSKVISFYHQGSLDSAEKYHSLLESDVSRSDLIFPSHLFSKALLQGNKGNHIEAIRILMESAILFQEMKNSRALFNVFNSLGVNYKKINDNYTSKTYYLKALDTDLSLIDSVDISMVFNNLGSIYNGLNELDSAVYYYKLGIDLLKGSENKMYLAQNYLNIGNIYEKKGQYKDAKRSFLKCLEISQNASIQYGIMISNLNLGNLSRLLGEYEAAWIYLNQAEVQAIAMKTKREEGLILERKSWIARDIEDYKTAYRLTLQASTIADSLLSERVKIEANKLQIQYDTEKKDRDLAESRLREQNLVIYIIISLLVLFMLATVVFWILYKKKKLQHAKVLIDTENKRLSSSLNVKELELTSMALQLIQIKKKNQAERAKAPKVLVPADDFYYDKGQSYFFDQDNWSVMQQDFEGRITENNKDFFKMLLNKYPSLSPSELRLCSYLRLNLSSKEIADLQNKSVRTIETTRFSLRKKMELPEGINLTSHLIQFEIN